MDKCKTCGKLFILGDAKQRYCRMCNVAWLEAKEKEREQKQTALWEEDRKQKQISFEEEIKNQPLINMEDIHLSYPLYIIGNGFDLMHRVQSSYYHFRDSLGKNSSLRFALENGLTPEDIWADFEEALGHPDMNLMASKHIVDMWLDDFGVFTDEDFGAAEYFAAIESAANPIISIVNELQPAFRRWVEKLFVGTGDRPLSKLIKGKCKALCFNYTEFPETLYGIKDICYIHGCRNNKRDRLILGHRPEMGEEMNERSKKVKTYRQAMVEVAQQQVLDLIGEYDEALIKNSKKIIERNRNFFDSLSNIDQIIVIGHSVSPVDWDYFREVNRLVSPGKCWYFGCHGPNDLRNVQLLIHELGIKNYWIFRTDVIWVQANSEFGRTTLVKKNNGLMIRRFKAQDVSVGIHLYNMRIKQGADVRLEVVLPGAVLKVVIIDVHIFVILKNKDILLFGKEDDWRFIRKLESFEYQNLLNRRLNHIFITDRDLTFVYNNRIRRYDLMTGELVDNRAMRNARWKVYSGTDVIKKFV